MGQGPARVRPAGRTRPGYVLYCMADDGGLSWPRGKAGIAMACRGEPPAPASTAGCELEQRVGRWASWHDSGANALTAVTPLVRSSRVERQAGGRVLACVGAAITPTRWPAKDCGGGGERGGLRQSEHMTFWGACSFVRGRGLAAVDCRCTEQYVKNKAHRAHCRRLLHDLPCAAYGSKPRTGPIQDESCRQSHRAVWRCL